MNKRKLTLMGPGFRDEFLQPFDTLFDQMLGETFPDMTKEFGVDFFSKGAYPRVDIIDRSKEILIVAEIPGLCKKDVEIDVEQNKTNASQHLLSISGGARVYVNEDGNDESEEAPNYIRKELKRSSFKRTFTLDNSSLDVDNIKASFENGLLEITVNKTKPIETKARKVQIN